MKKKKPEGETSYFKVSHKIWEGKDFQELSGAAIKLFIHLCKLRNRLRDKTDLDSAFWHTDHQLLSELHLSRNSLKKARSELLQARFIYMDYQWWGIRRFGPLYVILDDVYQAEADRKIDESAGFEFSKSNPIF